MDQELRASRPAPGRSCGACGQQSPPVRVREVCDRVGSRIHQSEEEVERCKPFFPDNQAADIVHAATCLHAGAVLISNDRHFERIERAGLIEVWTISEAIKNLLTNDKE